MRAAGSARLESGEDDRVLSDSSRLRRICRSFRKSLVMSDSTSRRPGRATAWLVGVLVLAALLRAGALAVGSGHLTEDRDDYLVVARHYVTHGFWHSFENIPDSFRPPLLPLVMAALLKAGGGSVSLGVFQLVLGTATVALTWHIGRRLGLGGLSAVAAALVALDPLLVEYTTFPMTETLFTFLVTLFVALATPKKREAAAPRFPQPGSPPSERVRRECSLPPHDLARRRTGRNLARGPHAPRRRARGPNCPRHARRPPCHRGRRLAVGPSQRTPARLARPHHDARRLHAPLGQQRSLFPASGGPSAVGGVAQQRARPLPADLVSATSSPTWTATSGLARAK